MTSISHLPPPIIESYEWQDRGACARLDVGMFFSPESERGAKRTRREENAKAVCRQCPVVAQCLDHALQVREPYGVWGGMTAGERQRLLEARPIAS